MEKFTKDISEIIISEIKIIMTVDEDWTKKERQIMERTARTCPVAKSLHPDLLQEVRDGAFTIMLSHDNKYLLLEGDAIVSYNDGQPLLVDLFKLVNISRIGTFQQLLKQTCITFTFPFTVIARRYIINVK